MPDQYGTSHKTIPATTYTTLATRTPLQQLLRLTTPLPLLVPLLVPVLVPVSGLKAQWNILAITPLPHSPTQVIVTVTVIVIVIVIVPAPMTQQ